jgi:hypothetical protein
LDLNRLLKNLTPLANLDESTISKLVTNIEELGKLEPKVAEQPLWVLSQWLRAGNPYMKVTSINIGQSQMTVLRCKSLAVKGPLLQHADKRFEEATKEMFKDAKNGNTRDGHFVRRMDNIADYSVSKSVYLFIKKSNLKPFMCWISE